jgi:GntR family transcriptional regulator/MocR family aminotransferase
LQRLDADLAGGAARRVAYVGTFIKTMFPNLRRGYCIVPAHIADAVANARAVADRNSPLVEQAALAEFIAEGHYDRHLRRVRKVCAERYALMRRRLSDRLGSVFELRPMHAGTHIVVTLRDSYLRRRRLSRDEGFKLPLRIAEAAAEAGLVVFPMQRYSLRIPRKPQLVLGYGGLSESLIASGVEKLARVIDSL